MVVEQESAPVALLGYRDRIAHSFAQQAAARSILYFRRSVDFTGHSVVIMAMVGIR